VIQVHKLVLDKFSTFKCNIKRTYYCGKVLLKKNHAKTDFSVIKKKKKEEEIYDDLNFFLKYPLFVFHKIQIFTRNKI